MFHSVKMNVAGGTLRGPTRRSFILGTSLLGLTLLTGCPQTPPQIPTPPQTADKELHFDKRYLDSLDGPRSARTQREMAIYTQIRRLEMSKNPRFRAKDSIELLKIKEPNDSIFESAGGGPLRGYRNQAALDADIHRKIDSLKVLEHIPVTPH
jgi:hypothetical protein